MSNSLTCHNMCLSVFNGHVYQSKAERTASIRQAQHERRTRRSRAFVSCPPPVVHTTNNKPGYKLSRKLHMSTQQYVEEGMDVMNGDHDFAVDEDVALMRAVQMSLKEYDMETNKRINQLVQQQNNVVSGDDVGSFDESEWEMVASDAHGDNAFCMEEAKSDDDFVQVSKSYKAILLSNDDVPCAC